MFNLIKYFQNFGGINFRTPELLKGATVATELKNVRLSENFGLSKRRGYQHSLKDAGGNGRVVYNNVDLTTGINNPQDLIADDTLKEITRTEISFALETESSFSTQIVLNPTTGTFQFRYTDEFGQIVDFDLGTGKEASPYTIENLQTDVLNSFDIILTTSVTLSTPAAFIQTTLSQAAVVNPLDSSQFITYHTAVNINPLATPALASGNFVPFKNHWAEKDSPDWEINSFVQLNDVLYITNRNDGLIKYDGAKVYKAGLPNAPVPTQTGAPTGAAVNWKYRVLFTHTDAKENVVNSRISEPLQINLNASLDIRVDTSSIWQTGYDTGIVAELYRTVDGGAAYYLVDSKTVIGPSVSFDNEAATDDSISIGADTEEFLFPVRNPDPPPKCQYATAFRNYLVLTGDPTAVNTVYFSDLEASEGFDLRNSLITGSRFGNANSGVKELDNNLYIFKPQSVFMFSGDIAAGIENTQLDTLADDGVGCVSHNSIVETNGSLYFLAPNGIYSVNRNGMKNETDDLTPLFVRPNYRANRAISFYWPIENKILFMLPQIDNGDATATSRILVRDIVANSWYIWDSWDFSGGIALDNTRLLYSNKKYSGAILDLQSELDYADHESAIEFSYSTHWETVGEPSIPKKFNRLKVYTLDSELQTFDSSNFTLDIATQHDYNDVDQSVTSMQFGATEGVGWGEPAWGEFEWGELKKLTDTKRLKAQKCQCLRIRFDNSNLHENVLISGFELEITTPYRAAIKDGR